MRFLSVLLVLLASLAPRPALAADPEVTVTLTAVPTNARVGDMVRLEAKVTTRGGSIEDLQLEDLRKYPELDVISHQTARPMSFSFGFGAGVKSESSLIQTYVLRANAPGTYPFTPAVARVSGKTYQSQPVTITITGSGAPAPTDPNASPPAAVPGEDPSGAKFDARAFLRTVVEPEEPYVGQQVSVTVYLYTRLRLGPQSIIPTKPPMDGFWVYDDPITTLQAQSAQVRGLNYQVYPLIRSTAFPQRSGELTLGSPKVSFDAVRTSFFDAPERINREGVPVSVNVKPLPEPVPPNAVVGNYAIDARLDRTNVKTGDAVTLTIDAGGVGNVQALRIDLPPIAGVRALQPAIRDRQSLDTGRLSGTRTWEWILIAEEPGAHTVPPLVIHYFDPETETYEKAQTEALTFTAVGEARPTPAMLEPVTLGEPEAEAEFGPIRMYSELSRSQVPVRDRTWFMWSLAIPPLAFMGLIFGVGVARRRESRATTSGAIQRKLLRGAREALETNDARSFYDRIVSSITHALDSKLGEPVGGLPQSELRSRLESAGFDTDLIDRIVNELEGADFARFAASGANHEEMERCLQRTSAIVDRVERGKGTT
jgi:hypothetical protein